MLVTKMVLEFDGEVALLQGALRTVKEQLGSLEDLDFQDVLDAVPIIYNVLQDIEYIRRNDNLSDEEINYRNRKLVAGIFYNLIKTRLKISWVNNDWFEALDGAYPRFGWPLFLGVIAAAQWHEHWFECMDAVHPAVLCGLIDETLPLISDVTTSLHVPVAVRILALLVNPVKIQALREFEKHVVTISKEKEIRMPDYDIVLGTMFDITTSHFVRHTTWASAVTYDYLYVLLRQLYEICTLLANDSINVRSFLEVKTLLKDVNEDNLKTVHREVFFCDSNEKSSAEIDLLTLKTFLRFFELCFEATTSLNWKQFYNKRPRLKLLKRRKCFDDMTELSSLLIELNYLVKKVRAVDLGKSDVARQLHEVLELFENCLESTLEEREVMTEKKIVATVDKRASNYQAFIDYMINHKQLVNNDDWLDCLSRSSFQLSQKQVFTLLGVLQTTSKTSSSFGKIQQIILQAFSSWPTPVRQHFHREYLHKFKSEGTLLLRPNFHQELTATFNKLVASYVDENLDPETSVCVALLCLQSPVASIQKAVHQAVNNDAQTKVIIEVLNNVWTTCRHRDSTNSLTVLGLVMKGMVDLCETEAHFQNFESFVRLLLKENMLPIPEISLSVVVPFLDKWKPYEDCKRLLLALKVLQIVLEDSSDVKWLKAIYPHAVLLYLGSIIYQCKLMCTGPDLSWIQVKTITVTLVEEVISKIRLNKKIITKDNVLWLQTKLKNVSESISFYYMDLYEIYDIEIEFSDSASPLELLFSFSACSDRNMQLASPWIKTALTMKKHPRPHVLSALTKVLPFCLQSEWERLMESLEGNVTLESSYMKSVMGTDLTLEAKEATVMVVLLCQLIEILNSKEMELLHMLRCFNLVVRRKMETFEHKFCDQDAHGFLAANVFIELCALMHKLSIKYVEEEGVMLLELGKMISRNKGVSTNATVVSTVTVSMKTLPDCPFKNTLLKSFKSMLFPSICDSQK